MKEKLRARKKETVSELPSESIFDSTPVFGEYQKDGDKKAKAAELEKHAKEIAEELHIRDLLGDQGQNTRDVEAEKQDQSSDTNFKGQETRGGVDLAKMHTLIDQSQELISWRDQTKERIKSLLKKKDDDSKEMLDLAKTELRLLRRELNKHQIQMEKVIDGKGADLEIGNPVQDVKTAMAREIVLPELDWIKLKIESGIEEVLPYVIVDLEVSKPISEMTQKEKEKIVDRALEPVFEMAKKRIFESMSEFARWEFRQTGTMIGQLINRRLRKLIPEILEFSAERTDKRVKNIIEQEEVEKLKRAEHEMEIKKSAARKETEAREAQDNAWMVEHELRKGKAEGLGGVYLGSSNNYIAPALVNQVFGNPKPVSSEQYVEDYPLIYTTVNFLHGWIDWKWAKRNEKLRLLLDQTRDFNYARRDFENFFGREVDNGFREMLERQTVLFYEECYGENGKEKDMKPQEFIRQLQDHMRAMIYGSEKRFFDQLAGRFDEAVSADIKLTHGFDKLLNMAVVRFLQLLTNLEIIEEYFKKNGFIFNFDKDGRIVEADPSTQSPEVIGYGPRSMGHKKPTDIEVESFLSSIKESQLYFWGEAWGMVSSVPKVAYLYIKDRVEHLTGPKFKIGDIVAFGADALGGNYDFNPGRAVVRTITPDYIADLSVEMIDGSDKGKIYALQSKYTHRISRPEFGFRKLDPAIIRFFGDNEEQAKKNIMLEVNGSVTRILRKKEAEYNVASPNFWTHMDSTIKDRLLDELLDLYRTVVTPINFPSLRDTFTQALDIIIKKEVDKLQPEQPHDPYLNGRM